MKRSIQLPTNTQIPTFINGFVDGKILASSFDHLLALDLNTETVVWIQPIQPKEVILEESVYFRNTSGAIGALNPLDGHMLWFLPNVGSIAIALSDEVLVSAGIETINGYSTLNGECLWSFPYAKLGGSLFLSSTDNIAQVLYQDKEESTIILSLDIKTGGEIWREKQTFPFPHVSTMLSKEDVLYAILRSGHIYAITNNTGTVLWNKLLPGAIDIPPYMTLSSMLLQSGDSLIELDLSTGNTLRTTRLPGRMVPGYIFISQDGVLVYYSGTEIFFRPW